MKRLLVWLVCFVVSLAMTLIQLPFVVLGFLFGQVLAGIRAGIDLAVLVPDAIRSQIRKGGAK